MYIPNETWMWIKAYKFYKQGIMPTLGGWLDQANKFNDVMLFIDNEIDIHQRNKDGRK